MIRRVRLVLLTVSLVALAALPTASSATSTASAVSADAFDAKALDMFRTVIAMQTSEGLGHVPALANYLAGEFRAAGFDEQDIHVLPLGETASLVVRFRGNGTGGRPVALLAHMDVVTAKREDWVRDPFTLIEENGFLFGRGTLDVKVGVVAITCAVLRLKAEGFTPSRDLIVVFTGDEETSGRTAKDLLTHHRNLVDAEFVLNSDGGGGVLSQETGAAVFYKLQTAEKTFASFDITVRNPGGHSSLPRKDNAIYALADVIKRVQAYQFPVMWNETTIASFRASGPRTGGPLGEAMRRFADNPKDEAAAAALADSPANIGMTRTTCVPTLLRGGHADNALPQAAAVTVNCRIFPGVAITDVQAALLSVAGPGAEIKPLDDYPWSDASPLRPDVVGAVTRAVTALYPELPVVPVQMSGATDGVFFRGAGIPTYGVSGVFIKDTDDFSHGLNERLPVRSFYDGLRFWIVLLKNIAGPASQGSARASIPGNPLPALE
jgi:acetylornithine deacetylase/succinyl-diaminopimelate desuccinylase-like protein